jgi:hypothetical protein
MCEGEGWDKFSVAVPAFGVRVLYGQKRRACGRPCGLLPGDLTVPWRRRYRTSASMLTVRGPGASAS